jgi:chromosome segregation ATPase
MENETEIDKLARIVNAGFDRMDERFEKIDERFAGIDNRLGSLDERFWGMEKHMAVLDQKIDHVDAKLDAHREETKDGFTAVHRAIGGLSHTLVDHEERIKALEGE